MTRQQHAEIKKLIFFGCCQANDAIIFFSKGKVGEIGELREIVNGQLSRHSSTIQREKVNLLEQLVSTDIS